MIKNIFTIATVAVALSACSGGGGSGGGGSTVTTPGFIGAPSATCGGVSCVPGATISALGAVHARTTDPSRAVDLYEAFNNGFIKRLNQFLTKVYAGMVAGGSQSCSDVDIGSSGTVNGYDFSITTANKSVATGFTSAGAGYDYRIYAAVGESPVAEVQVKCGADTVVSPLTVTARVNENGDRYEFIYEKSGNKIRVMGAGILATGERMISWFKTDDGNDFDLLIKSNIDGITDYYEARGNITGNVYLVSNHVDANVCMNSSGGAANCTGFTLNPAPALAVSNPAANWNSVNVGTFTILDP